MMKNSRHSRATAWKTNGWERKYPRDQNEKAKGEIRNPELDNRPRRQPRSRPRSRQGQKRLRSAEEQNNNRETCTPDKLEMQIEDKLQDNDGDSENTPWGIKLKKKGK